jgi:hypothetical protein
MSVINAETKTNRMVTVIMKAEGCPSSRDPVALAKRTKPHRIGNRIRMENAVAARRTQRAVKPEEAFASETARATQLPSDLFYSAEIPTYQGVPMPLYHTQRLHSAQQSRQWFPIGGAL